MGELLNITFEEAEEVNYTMLLSILFDIIEEGEAIECNINESVNNRARNK